MSKIKSVTMESTFGGDPISLGPSPEKNSKVENEFPAILKYYKNKSRHRISVLMICCPMH